MGLLMILVNIGAVLVNYGKTDQSGFAVVSLIASIFSYGELMDQEEFIQMALEWGQEDGWDIETYYKEYPDRNPFILNRKHEEYLDGLRVSTSTEFS